MALRWIINRPNQRRRVMPRPIRYDDNKDPDEVALIIPETFEPDDEAALAELLAAVQEEVSDLVQRAFRSGGILRLRGARRNC